MKLLNKLVLTSVTLASLACLSAQSVAANLACRIYAPPGWYMVKLFKDYDNAPCFIAGPLFVNVYEDVLFDHMSHGVYSVQATNIANPRIHGQSEPAFRMGLPWQTLLLPNCYVRR